MLRLVIIPIIAGFVATLGITGTLWFINRMRLTNADMVRAVGSLFTRSSENATMVGLAIHFLAGIIISVVYLHLLSLLNAGGVVTGITSLTFFGGLLGFVHGFIFSFIMVIVAEHHPVDLYQKADFLVAVAHVIGHIVYGLLLGLMFGILKWQGFDMSPGI